MKEFYIERTNPTRKGLLAFWKQGDYGYVSDVAEARVFSENHILKKMSIQNGTRTAWPKDYIDAIGGPGIFEDQVDRSKAYQPPNPLAGHIKN